MTISRRHFLELSGGVAGAAATHSLWLRAAGAAAPQSAAPRQTKLVLVYLAGGNDGLNTLVPYGSPQYYASRPAIGIPAGQVLKLPGSNDVGLHPSLVNLHALHGQGQVATIQGVGYDKPDLSHFGSLDVWATGSPTHSVSTGWLGRWLDLTPAGGSAVRAAAIGTTLPSTLIGKSDSGVTIPSLTGFQFADGADTDADNRRRHDAFLSYANTNPNLIGDAAQAFLGSARHTVKAVRAVNALAEGSPPPPTTPADQMSLAMTLLSSRLGMRIAMLTIGAFDHHSVEQRNHADQLRKLDDAIGRFAQLAGQQPDAADYLLVVFSEFGRRLQENGSGGTDHGTAGPVFVVGQRAVGGFHGAYPSLKRSDLDPNGNLVRTVDFREVYATLLDRWLGEAGSRDVLEYSSADGLHPVQFLR